jgi:tetratricopeptide (TPR) repeat protein
LPERWLYGAFRVIEVMRQLCGGVEHIHDQGYVHGDLKPGNVMMWGGLSPQVTDFGLARVTGSATLAAGTRRYMAPELLKEGESTPAADVYSAGVIFRDLLLGVDERLAGRDAVLPIVEAMVEPDSRNRPASFAEIVAALAAIVDKAPVPPGIPFRAGERLTWDEQHAHVLPERSRYQRALTLVSAGRIQEAVDELNALMATRPGDADALLLLAEIEAQSGRPDSAALALERIELETLTSHRVLNNLVLNWLRLERPDRAGQVVQRLAQVDGRAADVAYFRGWIAGVKGYVSDEINHYEKALELGGGDDVRFRLAVALKNAGRASDALTQLQRIGKDDPALGFRVVTVTARIYVDTNRYAKAKALLREALRENLGAKHTCYLYCELGFVLRREGLYAASIESYERALAACPGDHAALEGIELARSELAAHSP